MAGFFDYTKPGKGISKDAPKKKGIVSIGVLLIGLLLCPLITYTQIFMTNNTVKKYMFEPLSNLNSVNPQKEDFDFDFEERQLI